MTTQDLLSLSSGDVLTSLDGGVLTITMNRPDSLNALPASVFVTMENVIREATRSGAARVLVIRGAGKGFCSGADLDPDAPPSPDTLDAGAAFVTAVRNFPYPVVSVVHGPCAGIGVSIALAADLVVASEKAFFLLAFANIGLMPDGGATALVAASVGRARAMRMSLLGERVYGADALQWGLITHLASPETLEDEVSTLVAKLASGPSLAYGKTKAAINDMTLGGLYEAFQRERYGQTDLMQSADFVEGVAAFRERRTAEFTGR